MLLVVFDDHVLMKSLIMAWHDLQIALSIEVEQSGGLF